MLLLAQFHHHSNDWRMQNNKRPGDVFLDRYMPGASEEEREEARQNLYAYFAVLLKIATRRADEDWERGIRPDGVCEVELGDTHTL